MTGIEKVSPYLIILLYVNILSTSTLFVLGDDGELDMDLDSTSTTAFPSTTNSNLSNISSHLTMEELMALELSEIPSRDPYPIAIPMTLIYSLILFSGLVGNVSTCIVIASTGYMHTATNYYLFSLAMSDLLLLTTGVPQEIYHIWVKYPYAFGEAFCVLRGLAAETSANATVLTITAFTVERFVAIVYPLKGHLLSQLSRVIRMIAVIWLVAFCMALPQAAQFGNKDQMSVYFPEKVLIKGAWCTIVREIFPYAFHISICVFFAIPMTIISVLYILIGLKLRRGRKGPLHPDLPRPITSSATAPPRIQQQSHVIRMLVCVVVGFFCCYFPFHLQRILALYASSVGRENLSNAFVTVYKGLIHVSGILYFLSTCINPIFYHIMSNKFRQAFRDTMQHLCGSSSNSDPNSLHHRRNYSAMSHRSTRLGSNINNCTKSGSNNSLVMIGVPPNSTQKMQPTNSPKSQSVLATIEESEIKRGEILTDLRKNGATSANLLVAKNSEEKGVKVNVGRMNSKRSPTLESIAESGCGMITNKSGSENTLTMTMSPSSEMPPTNF